MRVVSESKQIKQQQNKSSTVDFRLKPKPYCTPNYRHRFTVKMKLNFSTLAKQIDDRSIQPRPIKPYQSQLQLNYYSKSTQEQHALSSFGRNKKSQLHEDNPQLFLGSSILDEYFSARYPSANLQLQQPKVNLSVMYPHQVSATVNPANIDQQIQAMKVRGILNESAVKFVKRQIVKDLSKSKSKKSAQTISQSAKKDNQSTEQLNQSAKKVQQSIFLGMSLQIDQNDTDLQNFTNRSLENVENESILGTTVSSKLFRHFLKQSTQNVLAESRQSKQEKRYSIEQLMSPSTKKKTPGVTPNYMNPIHREENSNQKSKKLIPTETIKLQEALKQVRSKPSLQLTKSSPFTQKIVSQRESQYRSKKSCVYQSLYNQAYKRQCMQQLNRQSKQRQIDQKINHKKTLQTNTAKRYKVQGTFMERLEKSIQRKYFKEYLTKKYSVDPRTGQDYFVPDTNCSKRTFEGLFHKSLEKVDDSLTLKNHTQKSKEGHKQSEIALSTHLTHTKKSLKRTKESSRSKHSQLQRLNRSMQSLNKSSKEKNQYKSKAIVDNKDSQVIERIVGLFYPLRNESNTTSKEKGFGIGEELGFQKTYEALFQLSEKEYIILTPLLEQAEQLQKSSKVTSLMFRNLVIQFFKKLNHYDKLILRERAQKTAVNENAHNHTSHQRPSQFEKSVDSRSSQPIKQSEQCSYRPRINEISASMEKLNPKYEAELYYV